MMTRSSSSTLGPRQARPRRSRPASASGWSRSALLQVAQLGGGLERVVVTDRKASLVPPDHLLRALERHVDVPLECRTRLRLDVSRRGEHPLDEVEQLGERLERACPEILLEARVLALPRVPVVALRRLGHAVRIPLRTAGETSVGYARLQAGNTNALTRRKERAMEQRRGSEIAEGDPRPPDVPEPAPSPDPAPAPQPPPGSPDPGPRGRRQAV